MELRRTAQAGVDLIKRFENVDLNRYICPAGYPTIGWGHLITKREQANGRFDGGISLEEAEELLKDDLYVAESIVADYVDVPLTDGQHAALVSFIFNCGEGNFRTSTLLKRVNAEDTEAGDEFGRWVYAGGKKLRGLIRRRKAETELYESDIVYHNENEPAAQRGRLASWLRLGKAA